MNNLIMRAALFAEFAHRGQSRSYSPGPYIVHPRMVAAHAARIGLSDNAIAAAFLHDVVEDCKVGLHEIRNAFGGRVCAYVDMLSDLQTPDEGTRAIRKQRYHQRLQLYVNEHKDSREHTERGYDEVITLKALDILDNARSIAGEDPKFWRVVLAEMKDFYEQFNHYMHPKAAKAFRKYTKE